MILLFIYQTYTYYKLDKKNQSILKNTFKIKRKSIQLLHNSKFVLLLVQMYY